MLLQLLRIVQSSARVPTASSYMRWLLGATIRVTDYSERHISLQFSGSNESNELNRFDRDQLVQSCAAQCATLWGWLYFYRPLLLRLPQQIFNDAFRFVAGRVPPPPPPVVLWFR